VVVIVAGGVLGVSSTTADVDVVGPGVVVGAITVPFSLQAVTTSTTTRRVTPKLLAIPTGT
jgi:hypothetical protein